MQHTYLFFFKDIHSIMPLQVVIPMIAALLCPMVVRPRLAWGIALIATIISFAISIQLFAYVLEFGHLTYHMGGWVPPVGIEYRVDLLNSFILLLVSGIGAIMLPYARKSIATELSSEKHPAFYAVFLLCFAGLLGITITNDAFNIYVFLEISSLATYTLIGMGKNRRALVAGFEYLILGTIGATLYLIGIGLLYMLTGTLNITDLIVRLSPVLDSRLAIAAFSFITLGLALKFALFPLHLWLCNAYTHSPSFVSAFLAATGTKVSIYVFIRIVFTIFGTHFAFTQLPLDVILMTLGLFSIIIGSLTAVYQKDVKRMLAYSSVAQIGYIILGISLGNDAGLTSGIVHLFNHALAKAGLFMAVGCVAMRFHGTTLDHFKGMGKEMPLTMMAFVICGLSLVGIPLTAGFISKWVLLVGVIDRNLWPVAIVIVLSSLLTVIYIWRVIEVAYFQEHPNAVITRTEAPTSMWLTTWIIVGAIIFFGINTEYSLGIASRAASMLLGGEL